MTAKKIPITPVFLDLPTVAQVVALSTATIERLEREGNSQSAASCPTSASAGRVTAGVELAAAAEYRGVEAEGGGVKFGSVCSGIEAASFGGKSLPKCGTHKPEAAMRYMGSRNEVLSVCSGIEAASVAWTPLGWEAVAFSEIEPFPCAVLAHHYPSVPNWGDMTKFQEWPDADVDLLCGGTHASPSALQDCEKGLADPRGNLMLTFGAIAAKYRPHWLVWENVPGVLSSNGGRDFGAFLGCWGNSGMGSHTEFLTLSTLSSTAPPTCVRCRMSWRLATCRSGTFERHSLSGILRRAEKRGKELPAALKSALQSVSSQASQASDSDTHATLDANNGSRRHNGVIHAAPIARCDTAGEANGRIGRRAISSRTPARRRIRRKRRRNRARHADCRSWHPRPVRFHRYGLRAGPE